MSKQILVKFDNTLPDEEVHKVLLPSSIEEGGNRDTGQSEMLINGMKVPIVKFNDTSIAWQNIESFKLTCDKFLPEISLKFCDASGTLTNLATPGPDNHVIIEILPYFEGVYKKIKLKFYIYDINISTADNMIGLSGTYVCDKLNDSTIESFGKISTYKFAEEIAHRLKLGLCSNLDDSEDDRYIYISNGTYISSIQREISLGGNPKLILDGWIDWWNNINIIDIFDAYSGPADNNLTIWTYTSWNTTDPRRKDKPVEIPATITNNVKMQQHPLYIEKFDIISSNESNVSRGTDKAINVFDINSAENDSILIQDGTGVKESVYTQYYYRGEYNQKDNDGSYLMQNECVSTYKQKIDNNLIRVCIGGACLGLMRGHRVNLEWYDYSEDGDELYKMNKDIVNTNIPMEEDDTTTAPVPFAMNLNKKISGQYYIVSTYINYDRVIDEGGPKSVMGQYFVLSKQMDSYNYADAVKDNNY